MIYTCFKAGSWSRDTGFQLWVWEYAPDQDVFFPLLLRVAFRGKALEFGWYRTGMDTVSGRKRFRVIIGNRWRQQQIERRKEQEEMERKLAEENAKWLKIQKERIDAFARNLERGMSIEDAMEEE